MTPNRVQPAHFGNNAFAAAAMRPDQTLTATGMGTPNMGAPGVAPGAGAETAATFPVPGMPPAMPPMVFGNLQADTFDRQHAPSSTSAAPKFGGLRRTFRNIGILASANALYLSNNLDKEGVYHKDIQALDNLPWGDFKAFSISIGVALLAFLAAAFSPAGEKPKE